MTTAKKNPPGARKDFVEGGKGSCDKAEKLPKCDVEGKVMNGDRKYGSGERSKK